MLRLVGVVALALAAPEGCEDGPLWVDGRATTCAASGLACETWFGAGRPYGADACACHCAPGAACGDAGGVRDCAGRCVAPVGVGDGCCDAGASGGPDYACAAFACDGGDCEACARARAAAPSPVVAPGTKAPWCVLLTATVCPARGMTHTNRVDPAVRAADYAASLARWAGPNGTKFPLAVVENSGASLDALRAAAGATPVEFHSYVDRAVEPARGKGHAEARAIWRTLAGSPLLARCERVAKVTGRYFVENFDAALDAAGTAPLVVQSTPSPWVMWDGVLRSEVVGFANDKRFAEVIFEDQDEAAGLPMERQLFVAARKYHEMGVEVAFFPPLAVPPTPNGEESHVITTL